MFPVVYFYRSSGDPSRDDGIDFPEPGGIGDIAGDNVGSGSSSDVETRGETSLRGPSKINRHMAGLNNIDADRPIFTLSVAADLLGLHPRTLRIYEEKGLVVPARTEGNRRRYSQNDILRFQMIRQLTRSGVNLEGVRIILGMADELTRLGGDPEKVIEKHAQAIMSDEA